MSQARGSAGNAGDVMHEIDLTALAGLEDTRLTEIECAIEACRDGQRVTYLAEGGRRVAAICPPEWVLTFGQAPVAVKPGETYTVPEGVTEAVFTEGKTNPTAH